MENNRSTMPLQKRYEYAYRLAYELACEQLAKINDIEQQCRKSSAQYRVIDSQTEIIIRYLNQSYLIRLPNIEISLVDSVTEIPIRDKLLILHYFTSAKGTPSANKLITFRELPEGKIYFPTFYKRTSKPLLDYFGKEPHLLVDVARKLGDIK